MCFCRGGGFMEGGSSWCYGDLSSRRPQITFVAAEPLTSNTWFTGSSVVSPPPQPGSVSQVGLTWATVSQCYLFKKKKQTTTQARRLKCFDWKVQMLGPNMPGSTYESMPNEKSHNNNSRKFNNSIILDTRHRNVIATEKMWENLSFNDSTPTIQWPGDQREDWGGTHCKAHSSPPPEQLHSHKRHTGWPYRCRHTAWWHSTVSGEKTCWWGIKGSLLSAEHS